MPLLSDLRQTTTPVQITHGNTKFTLDCALEKEAQTLVDAPTEGTTFSELEQAEYALEIRRGILNNQVQEQIALLGNLGDVDALRRELEQERDAPLSARQRKEAPAIAFEEIEAQAQKRLAALEGSLNTLRAQLESVVEELNLNRATQLAFLVAGSDITDEHAQGVLCGKVNKTPEELLADARVFASFSPPLFRRCLKAVVEAIDGPLAPAG